MTGRVALISDLHANEVALDAVERDLRAVGVDRVVCLGDVATLGARPREVLARVAALCDTCVLGNHDEFLLDPTLVHTYTQAPIVVDAVDWCRAELGERELAWVRTYVREARIDLGGGATLAVFHGSPRSNMEDLLATTPPDALDQALAGRTAEVLAGGHTHLQMLRQHQGAWIVNPGSVGMPFRAHAMGRAPEVLAHAEYAMVTAERGTVAVTLCRVPLDRAGLRAQAESAAHPLRAALSTQYA